MKVTKFSFLLFIGAAFLLLTGCSLKSEEEAIKSTKAIVEKTFKEEGKESNQEMEGFSLYIPDHLETVEKGPSNVIFENGDQTFILFYNALEEPTSQLNYEEASSADKPLLLTTFEKENKFGYLRIIDTDDGYELQVGVGGVKITTITSKGDMEQSAEDMMVMANSLVKTEAE
ncbi:hypothetical protein KO561_13100 [Radiobacillus kanasensis]|uniref:hypothetical protein n=1 Tax=Radiobacillus kanasensis TaxID=2844358 RepID=UPI001E37BFDA|nr:hypothetical protein [Radiobacillus kanasensis]UFT98140.1 hypothetical protein KO561_13100 [Radiobacillus kanasensis]